MQSEPAQSSSQGRDPSASASASDPHHADNQTQPAKKPGRIGPQGLFARASRENSLPEFIEGLELARDPTRPFSKPGNYPGVIRTGLFFSIKHGRTALAAYLLNNEPLAPAILREHIPPDVVGQNPSIPLFEVVIAQHGWDVDTVGPQAQDKRPLISWVLQHHNEHELVCWLLDHNAKVDFGEDNYGLWPRPPALLETCAKYGSVESFKLLQAKGAKLGRRTLHFSCAMAAYYGADPGVSSQEQDNLGQEELGEQGTQGTEGPANVSVDANAEAEAKAKALVERPKRAAMLQYLVDEVGLDVNQTDTDIIGVGQHYGTPICYAAQQQRGAAVVRWLIAKGADPLFIRYNVDADACARAHRCYEVLQVLKQWKELNPEKVQNRNPLGFETPSDWIGRTWQEWEAHQKGLGRTV